MKKKWKMTLVVCHDIAEECERLTNDGWEVHTILPVERFNDHGETWYGARIVAHRNVTETSSA